MAHNHFCEQCKVAVAHCDGDEASCPNKGPQYCAAHHPDPAFRANVPEQAKMTVRVLKEV